MAIWDHLSHELVDIVEWLDDTNDTLVWRFPRYENQIKNGAQLIVRQGQVAVFVNQGQLADVFQPGTHTLTTQNLPILSTLLGWKYGFNSPFKAEVYFVSTRQFTDLKWGTKNPIMLRDPEFGPVRLRAFGTYVIRAKDAGKLLQQIVGTDSRFTTQEITEQLRDLIVSRFAAILGESRIPALDLAGKYDELGKFIAQRIEPEFDGYGLELTTLLVENISLPPEVEAAMDKRTSMGVVGNLSQYTQYQAANALEEAAKNPGGAASGGMGLGMGFAMANQIGGAMVAGAASGPPPVPGAGVFFLVLDGKQAGPFDQPGLLQQAQSGKLTRATLVWKQGMANWSAAGDVSDLAPLLASVPPPPPGPEKK